MVSRCHRTFQRQYIKYVFLDVTGNTIQFTNGYFGQVTAGFHTQADRLAHNFMCITKRYTLADQVICKICCRGKTFECSSVMGRPVAAKPSRHTIRVRNEPAPSPT